MNRHEKRKAAKSGDVVQIAYGRLLDGDPNRGMSVECYACRAHHGAVGVATALAAKHGDSAH